MYRIELTPGEVTVFRTIEELATGVRNGVVTPRARIYHAASEKWLPIEFHPHYKKIIETPAGRAADSPAPRPAERPRSERVGVEGVLAGHAPAGPSRGFEAEPDAPEPAEAEPESDDSGDGAVLPVTASPVLQLPKITYPQITPAESPVRAPSPAGRRSRRPMHLAGVVLVLALGGYVVVSAFSPAWTDGSSLDSASPDAGGSEAAPAAAATPTVERPLMPAANPNASKRLPVAVKPTGSTPAAPLPPASSGFAAALDPRANVPAPAPARSVAPVHDSALAQPPAALDLDLAVPALPGADSIAAEARHRDSAAMKRILRALNGKDAPAQP